MCGEHAEPLAAQQVMIIAVRSAQLDAAVGSPSTTASTNIGAGSASGALAYFARPASKNLRRQIKTNHDETSATLAPGAMASAPNRDWSSLLHRQRRSGPEKNVT